MTTLFYAAAHHKQLVASNVEVDKLYALTKAYLSKIEASDQAAFELPMKLPGTPLLIFFVIPGFVFPLLLCFCLMILQTY